MRRYVRAVAALLGVALTNAVAAAPAVAGPASSTGPGPRASASTKAAGIFRPGQAYMGWSLRDRAASDTESTQSPMAPGPKPSTCLQEHRRRLGLRPQRFAFVKATAGNYYTSAAFNSQYSGSYDAGPIRGAYHFANPSTSSGSDQANFFVEHDGGWSADGRTLPRVLDIEYDPYGPTCYNRTPQQITVSVIASFTRRYKELTGRDAVIYSTYGWWKQCTDNTTAFSQTNPLWIAYYEPTPGLLSGGWSFYTFWH